MESNTIKLAEGLEKFNLVFTDRDDEAVEISFNPNDTDIILRIKKATDNISAELEKIGNGESQGSSAEYLRQINEVIYREIDCIFGNNVSEKVFKHCGPLSLNSDGISFAERFLTAIAPHIQKRIEETNKASAMRISKHTAKYGNGKAAK